MKRFGLILLFIVAGCEGSIQLSENEERAAKYLEEQGYTVISIEDESSFKYSASQLLDQPWSGIWDVQSTKPEAYTNKAIVAVSFIIKDHPLDDASDRGKTNATVYLSDQEVIGGISFPHSNGPLIGQPYSLVGKTAEEIDEQIKQE
ncbi:hypothetical protein [Planomicrobium sp. CPCC 101079]|uniref:hypothetical protein n=1 Tax=Planomicrobium sp. CPCC 101079 TaxID=2599618 RepID=UPI0011B7C4C7|nr:hypothetical protein [Planomicrobium sp. CPCC 101079]TWT09243.1 hypothetical protein FQV28_06310 [Planomicrobium sp. CPCC 101079]